MASWTGWNLSHSRTTSVSSVTQLNCSSLLHSLCADQKLARVKTAPVIHHDIPMGDDAAGFKKPLRFRCISCDKPLGLKSAE